MQIAISILMLIGGLYLVIKGADYLVDGASSLASKRGVPAIVIGLTIVSFGTSAPELVVSVISALKGSTQTALGNIIGSNIFNTLIILGVSAWISPLKVKGNTVFKEIPFALFAAVSVLILGTSTLINQQSLFTIPRTGQSIIGELGVAQGLMLLGMFVIFMYYIVALTKSGSQDEDNIPKNLTNKMIGAYIIGGLAALLLGGQWAVNHAVKLAQVVGISDKIIGLTILAVGTSLPELVTSIKAAHLGQTDIAVGNAIGSNIFNIFWILGIVALIRPIPLNGGNITDLVFLIATTIMMFGLLFINRRFHIEKFEGSIMILLYVGYVGYLLINQ